MTTPMGAVKQHRKQAILHELAEPLSTEAYFIGVAAMCASGEDTYEKREAIFKEFHERMMSAWINDCVDELLDRIAASPSVNRRQRRENDIERFVTIAKKMGL
jgi:hypothetical protein